MQFLFGCNSVSSSFQSVRAFFRTNKNTCREWLNRIRLALMTVALENDQCAMVVRLAAQALFDANLLNSRSKVLLFARIILRPIPSPALRDPPIT